MTLANYTATARRRKYNASNRYTKFTDSVHGKLASKLSVREVNRMFKDARNRYE